MKTFKLLLYSLLIGLVFGSSLKYFRSGGEDIENVLVIAQNKPKFETKIIKGTQVPEMMFSEFEAKFEPIFKDCEINKPPEKSTNFKDVAEKITTKNSIKKRARDHLACDCSHTDVTKEPCITIHLKPIYVTRDKGSTNQYLAYHKFEIPIPTSPLKQG